jgi:hypothetical protein
MAHGMGRVSIMMLQLLSQQLGLVFHNTVAHYRLKSSAPLMSLLQVCSLG